MSYLDFEKRVELIVEKKDLESVLVKNLFTAVGFANRGENLFPSDVVFTKENGRYYVDIL